jgi:glycosyltransferase involved in cell wall biosynthesis
MIVLASVLATLPLAIALYAYVAYPALLWLFASRKVPAPAADIPTPLVTIVVPAYNEERQIGGAIESLLALDYPPDRRQILILSDASTDRTDAIVGEYAARGVELFRAPERMGKTGLENAATGSIRGAIVVNSDASIRMHPAAVRRLVRAMADSRVGVASTTDVSMSTDANINAAESGYVSYEMWVRALETRAGGIVGASGSGYAIRTALHSIPVRADLSRDFSAALTAERNGLRAVSVADALCFVPRTAALRREYRRKVRTISRGLETLYFNRDLLDPSHHGLFAWKLISHKICRWLVPLSVMPAAVGLGLLAMELPWVRWLLGVGVIGLLLALAGVLWPEERPIPRVLPAGVMGALAANLAVIHALWRFFHGHEDHIWEPTRRAHS